MKTPKTPVTDAGNAPRKLSMGERYADIVSEDRKASASQNPRTWTGKRKLSRTQKAAAKRIAKRFAIAVSQLGDGYRATDGMTDSVRTLVVGRRYGRMLAERIMNPSVVTQIQWEVA